MHCEKKPVTSILFIAKGTFKQPKLSQSALETFIYITSLHKKRLKVNETL